jgi:hypothetical protein
VSDADGDVLDLRELFAHPWEGEGSVWLPLWLRWMPVPRTFRFRTEMANVTGNAWDVIDTTTYPNGNVERRRMRAHQTSPTQISLEADDMPQGAQNHLRADGFDFEPYLLRVKVLGRLRLPLRCRDQVRVTEDGKTLVDSLEMRLLGILVGRAKIRLKRTGEAG